MKIMNEKRKTTNKNLAIRIFILIPLVLIVLLCVTLSILPAIDRAISIPLAANRVNVEPSEDAIKSYIKNKLKPGMSREDVNQVLDKLGPYTVYKGDPHGIVVDEIVIKICIHPLNWFTLFVHYDVFPNVSLTSIEFYESPLF
jgi:hypothetical protein